MNHLLATMTSTELQLATVAPLRLCLSSKRSIPAGATAQCSKVELCEPI